MVTKTVALASLLVFSLLVPSAEGRWATADDSPVLEENTKVSIEVAENGTWDALSETSELVKNDEGREKAMHFQRTFNAKTMTYEILQAKTISPTGQETVVPPALIETKPLASSASGFDDLTQITVAFPAVTVGSKLYRKSRVRLVHPTFAGFFSYRFAFGDEHMVKNAEYRIRSALPLHVDKNDPSEKLQVTQTRDGKSWVVTIALKGEHFAKAADEPNSFLPQDRQTWVIVASAVNYVPIVRTVAPAYETLIAATLPPPFLAIAESAKAETNTVDKLNHVTSKLASMIRYVGDWRAVGGTHIPHSLEHIAANRFGDCKDYAITTVAILRRLGLSANVAWIYSGFPAFPLPRLPFDAAFNHAIVRVKDQSQTYWIDPTHGASFAQGIFEHIADRSALVIGDRDGTIDKIPALTPASSAYVRQFHIRPEKDRSVAVGARIDLAGRASVGWTGQALRSSKEAIRYSMLNALSGGKPVEGADLAPFDLGGRIVKDFAISGSFIQHNALLQTSAGTAYPLEDASFKLLMDLAIDDRVSDVLLTQPVRQESTYTLIGALASGKHSLGCELQSPWMDVTRTVTTEKKNTVVHDVFEIKRAILPISDFRTPRFIEFQRKMRACLYQVAIVFSEKPVKKAPPLKTPTGPKKLAKKPAEKPAEKPAKDTTAE